MRRPRLKPDYQDTWHHLYNRTVGASAERPFGRAEKEMLARILQRISLLYVVRVVSYQFMSNHFHLLVHAPAEVPSEEETVRRFEAFHGDRKTLTPGSPACRQWQRRLRDVSWFARHFEHLYSVWFNRTRGLPRRGPLWAGRFKNTVLESGAAVWNAWVYIERNAVRAGLVRDPADYRFCSYGAWRRQGRHPFAENLEQLLAPALGALGNFATLDALRRALQGEFDRRAQAEQSEENSHERRCRMWVEGVAIGSELFVREVMARAHPLLQVLRRRLGRTDGPDAPLLYCWQRPRTAGG